MLRPSGSAAAVVPLPGAAGDCPGRAWYAEAGRTIARQRGNHSARFSKLSLSSSDDCNACASVSLARWLGCPSDAPRFAGPTLRPVDVGAGTRRKLQRHHGFQRCWSGWWGRCPSETAPLSPARLRAIVPRRCVYNYAPSTRSSPRSRTIYRAFRCGPRSRPTPTRPREILPDFLVFLAQFR